MSYSHSGIFYKGEATCLLKDIECFDIFYNLECLVLALSSFHMKYKVTNCELPMADDFKSHFVSQFSLYCREAAGCISDWKK